jgi:hypothetical protein
MTASDQQRYYFDIEDASKASGSTTSDDPFGRTMKLSTRADVAAGRSGIPFDLLVDENGSIAEISGIEAFTQSLATRFLGENESFPPDQMDDDTMDGLETEFEQLAADDGRVTAVNAVTVRPSNRQYDDEIEVSMTIDTREGEYTTEFFIGDASTLDAAG